MPNLMMLLPREIRVTREQRERLVLCVTLGFWHDCEEGARRGARHYLESGNRAAGFLGHSRHPNVGDSPQQFTAALSVCDVHGGSQAGTGSSVPAL